jgi:medium-chain acyl-[acyl-carrier-protein] hydrolase
MFFPWAQGLPKDVEVCAIQLPGHAGRLEQPPFSELLPLTRAIANAMTPLLDRPFSCLGHSLGALLAFEVIRILRDRKEPQPTYLFASGCSSPHVRKVEKPTHDLPDGQFVQRLRELNGTPAELFDNTELIDLLLPAIRADFRISETYAYVQAAPISCSIIVFGGKDEKELTVDKLRRWSEHSTGETHIALFPGDHFFIHAAQKEMMNLVGRFLATRRAEFQKCATEGAAESEDCLSDPLGDPRFQR